jgi:HlyD family secretion protein
MNSTKSICTIAVLLLTLTACKNKTKNFDATGSFEAEEIIVSAEQSGKILTLNIAEGQELASNITIGQIDVASLNVQKEQTIASVNAIGEKVNNAAPQVGILNSQIKTQQAQIATLNQQLAVLSKELNRTQNLVSADAVPQKQLDDLVGQKSILQKQIAASKEQIGVLNAQIISANANVAIQNRGVRSEVNPAKKRIAIIDEQISRGQIKNIVAGTVLTKYAIAGEYTNIGKPLYKIADLSNIILRAYITGNQLPQIKLNQKVKVNTDDGLGGFKETEGIITWINSKAEFTPKTIQTKDERANMVYAIKVLVKNNGMYKIGMYGEIKFN